MDWLTFTSEVLRILAWPITILVVVVVLKRPITTLIREVIRVKWKDLEIEFEVVHARVTDVSTSQALEFYSISRRLASKLAKL